ncbi:PH domain-containing protein [Natrarchaeobius halalkaliphilus]|uniref:PH domain-containing protein n=1 Tax=Natrarchaeobius halalkaliphilus TaxID=1679091 RepID=A0A3N6LZC3_9EURY|nr:PH domain-containing protein [Natrarchaeobius halalkaliphilus]RQG93264.1 PH domain-containing protein [Natrarchaeobius halalkaliphilus]
MAFSTTPDWFHLGDDEEIVWESRPHPIELGVAFPVAVVLVVLGLGVTAWGLSDERGVVTGVGIVLVLGGGATAAVRYLFWTNTRYVITSSELYKKRGVISRDVTQFRLERVQNTSLSQSVLGRTLGYGDLTVYTAGSGDPELTFEHVPRPEHASSILSDQLALSSAGESAL